MPTCQEVLHGPSCMEEPQDLLTLLLLEGSFKARLNRKVPSALCLSLEQACTFAGSADVRENGGASSPERSTNAFRSGNERLYEAYNDLHSLAQDFEKPFDAPAILVVGHQTDGKSGRDNSSWGCNLGQQCVSKERLLFILFQSSTRRGQAKKMLLTQDPVLAIVRM